MELMSLSIMPYRPCMLLKCAKATILIDAAVNMETLATFHPYTITGKYVPPEAPAATNGKENGANRKNILDHFFDATPELQPVLLKDVSLKDVDAILISNWASLMGLPFLTERNDFYGVIYCTVPTKELGGLAMHELASLLTHVRSKSMTDELRTSDFYKKFTRSIMLDPTQWAPVYTKEEVEKCLHRISSISLGESKMINGVVKCTAHSSGYAIGSCNWTIEFEGTTFGYITTSSSKSTHMRPANMLPFRNLDILAITSLAQQPNEDPYKNCRFIGGTMAETLSQGGNVLFPVNPVGYIFDLLEVIFSALEEHRISRDVPVYFISPVAAQSLAYINLYTEWLAESKATRVYSPEEPFAFNDLVRENRIKVYDSIYGAFSREFRTPCVVLTGHPSLHFGNVVNFLEMWGRDKKSAIITTDPDFSMREIYKPYRKLLIRAYDYPIESRTNFSYVNMQLLPELKPKSLLIPEEYTKPMSPETANETSIIYNKIIPFSAGQKLPPFRTSKRKRALIQDDIAKSLHIEPKKARTIATCSVRGFLSTYDNDLEIITSAQKDTKDLPPTLPPPKYVGTLSPERLIKALSEGGITAEYGTATAGECSTIRIPQLKAEIRITSGGHNSRICCSSAENRRRIQKILVECLEEL